MGMMWVSILGLGLSAAALGIRRMKNPKINMNAAMQNFLNNMRTRNSHMPDMTNALMELSKDITPTNDTYTKK